MDKRQEGISIQIPWLFQGFQSPFPDNSWFTIHCNVYKFNCKYLGVSLVPNPLTFPDFARSSEILWISRLVKTPCSSLYIMMGTHNNRSRVHANFIPLTSGSRCTLYWPRLLIDLLLSRHYTVEITIFKTWMRSGVWVWEVIYQVDRAVETAPFDFTMC